MDNAQYEEMISFLRKEAAQKGKEAEKLAAELADTKAQLRRANDAVRDLYVAACLKFGTMVATTISEMVLPTCNMGARAECYKLTVTERVDKGEQTVRVQRL